MVFNLGQKEKNQKRLVIITIVDGNDNDRRQLSGLLKTMNNQYDFLVTPKKIEVMDVKEVLEQIKKSLEKIGGEEDKK